jgi:hypothetical protein
MIGLLPHPLPLSSVSKLSVFLSLPVRASDGGEGRGGAKSYDGEDAWPSINHSILSVIKVVQSLAEGILALYKSYIS